VNAKGGQFGSALQAASWNGHEAVIRLLLAKGAEVNAQGGYYGDALQAASREGYVAVVQLLLEKGADVNARGGQFGNALQAALLIGHEGVLRLLLEKGADVSAQGGFYGHALQAASRNGHEPVVRLLLENGADVEYMTPYSVYINSRCSFSYSMNLSHTHEVRSVIQQDTKSSTLSSNASHHFNWLQLKHNQNRCSLKPSTSTKQSRIQAESEGDDGGKLDRKLGTVVDP
jgi:hypothetical protein